MTKTPSMIEEIPKRKIVVYKTLVDPTVVKIAGEKLKIKMFTQFLFMKPRPEEIQTVSVEKSYEPYFLVDGKYAMDYYRKRFYTFNVDRRVQEIILLEKTLTPDLPKKHSKVSYQSITLEGKERLLYENKACLLLNVTGREVNPRRVPSAPCEEHPKKVLKKFNEIVKNVEAVPNKEIEVLSSKIVKRPTDVERVVKEQFQVSERSVIYKPVYKLTFKNARTDEVKTVKIDGVTGRPISW